MKIYARLIDFENMSEVACSLWKSSSLVDVSAIGKVTKLVGDNLPDEMIKGLFINYCGYKSLKVAKQEWKERSKKLLCQPQKAQYPQGMADSPELVAGIGSVLTDYLGEPCERFSEDTKYIPSTIAKRLKNYSGIFKGGINTYLSAAGKMFVWEWYSLNEIQLMYRDENRVVFLNIQQELFTEIAKVKTDFLKQIQISSKDLFLFMRQVQDPVELDKMGLNFETLIVLELDCNTDFKICYTIISLLYGIGCRFLVLYENENITDDLDENLKGMKNVSDLYGLYFDSKKIEDREKSHKNSRIRLVKSVDRKNSKGQFKCREVNGS